jgi:hypothetical protein
MSRSRTSHPSAVVRTTVLGVPSAALALGGWWAWGGALHWQDLVVLAITYKLTGGGITVVYHRLFTHRSFKTTRTLRALLAVLGSMAVEGPVIEWVATHRKHHLEPNRLIAVRRAREDSRCCDRAAVFELHRHAAHTAQTTAKSRRAITPPLRCDRLTACSRRPRSGSRAARRCSARERSRQGAGGGR